MTEQLRDTWKPVLIELQQMLKPTEFMTWFRNTALLNMENKVATIGVPVEAAIHRIQTRHKDTIIKAFKANEIEIGNIKFEVDNALNNESDDRVISLKSVKQVATKIKRKAQTDGIRISENISSRVLNPKYTLDNFIVGSGSQLAHAAFKAVCKNPGKSYNPLFIYGGVGLGKTHLLQSSGNEILKTDRDKLVVYTTSEKFTSELVSAIQGGVKIIDKWKKQYRKVDVFIVDDIQFIAGKQQTQEEIFHIFNILKEAGKQIIFSSDRPPKEIKKLDDRLVSRFESGMIVDIQQPDFETRSAILSSKAQEQGKFLPSDVIEYIAHNVSDSVRQLEGVLTQFLAEMDLLDIEPSINLAESVLRRNGTITQIESLNNPSSSGWSIKKSIDHAFIIETVSDYFHIPQRDMVGTKRKKEIMQARQVSMYMIKHELGYALERIGEIFGGKNHTTVMHSINKITTELEVDPDGSLAKDMRNLRHKLSD